LSGIGEENGGKLDDSAELLKRVIDTSRRISKRAKVSPVAHIPDWAVVYVIWAAWIAVVITIGIIVMLWRYKREQTGRLGNS
jgi:hypothetical protein